MDKARQRQFERESQSRRLAKAKADGKQAVAWILPVGDLAFVDAVKTARAFASRAEAVSLMLNVIRDDPKLRKELGL